MFTVVGYYESLNTGNVLTYVTPIPDQHVTTEGDNVIVPVEMNNLLAAMHVAETGEGAQIESPALRRTLLLDFSQINRSLEPLSPPVYMSAFYNPLPLDEREPMRALVRGSEIVAENKVVIVWLGDGAQTPIGGEIYTLMAWGSTPLTPFSWTTVPLTLSQVLPAGSYQVVGARAKSDGCLAARLIFVGGTWRPGVIGTDFAGDVEDPIFRRGGLGVWGEFTHDQPPKVEFLSRSGEAAQYVWLDLIKIA